MTSPQPLGQFTVSDWTDDGTTAGFRPPQSTRIGTDEIRRRTRAAMERGTKSIMEIRNACEGETAIICGGGPSLKDHLGTIRKLYNRGLKIICTNKTHDWLVERNFRPWAVVLLDPMPHVAGYVKRATAQTKALIAGQCHEDTFKALSHADCYLWHAGDNQDEEMMPVSLLKAEYPKVPWKVIGGGNTGGLRSIYVAQSVGFRKVHLFGFDSSMRAGKLYAYDKAHPADAAEGPATLRMNGHEQEFYTNEHMARQVENFQDMLTQVRLWNQHKAWEGLDDIIVHGRGMLPGVAAGHGLHAEPSVNAMWAKGAPPMKQQRLMVMEENEVAYVILGDPDWVGFPVCPDGVGVGHKLIHGKWIAPERPRLAYA